MCLKADVLILNLGKAAYIPLAFLFEYAMTRGSFSTVILS